MKWSFLSTNVGHTLLNCLVKSHKTMIRCRLESIKIFSNGSKCHNNECCVTSFPRVLSFSCAVCPCSLVYVWRRLHVTGFALKWKKVPFDNWHILPKGIVTGTRNPPTATWEIKEIDHLYFKSPLLSQNPLDSSHIICELELSEGNYQLNCWPCADMRITFPQWHIHQAIYCLELQWPVSFLQYKHV